MPTYVYECKTCSTVFERWQSISEPPVTDCDCGAIGTVKRVMQPVGIAFKGEGFHINDYAGKAAPVEKKAEAKTESTGTDHATPPATTETPAATPAPAPVKSESTP
ncbi:zinc ribbon domain-containing protein [bacterium]|nr:MAG: zinc ribbon domain-containing protein [bacterium]